MNKFLYPIFILLSFFCLSGSVKADYITPVDDRLFAYYSRFSDEDLTIINDYFNSFTGWQNIYSMVTVSKYLTDMDYYSDLVYLFAFDYDPYYGYTNSGNDIYYPYLGDFKNINIFEYNFNDKSINLVNLTLEDIFGYNLLSDSSFNWVFNNKLDSITDTQDLFYYPLYARGLYRISSAAWMFGTSSNIKYYITNNGNLDRRLQNCRNLYSIDLGEQFSSYIDYVFSEYTCQSLPYKVQYYFDDVLNENLSFEAWDYYGREIIITPDNKFDDYILKNDSNNYSIVISDNLEENVINVYYIKNSMVESPDDYTDIDTKNSYFYFLINYDDLKEMFPGVNFDSFNQFNQFLILIVINIFYLLFWSFVIWIVLKIVYKFFQWL